ncbi:MAG: putative tryptophan/tyrosine transport system permease protein [Thermotogaceae bacterium]|nr:putative tryptophan/tyrosine transport system permease protein [Thermotogaceae bacterium]
MIAIIEQGIIIGITGIGVFLTFRILDMPDLTVEGSFGLGGAVTVGLIVLGLNPIMALLIAMILGGLAGLITGLIFRKLNVHVLLAGILVMTMLYSVNIRVMQGPNLPIPITRTENKLTNYEDISGEDPLADLFGDLEQEETQKVAVEESQAPTTQKSAIMNIFDNLRDGSDLFTILSIAGVIILILFVFLKTDLGTVLRGFGSNPEGVEAFGMSRDFISIFGLSLANVLVALSGGMFAMYSGFADVTMGQGMITTGLAMVMVGEIIFGRFKPLFGLIAPIIGGVVYQSILALVMRYGYKIGFRASDMKLLTALFIISVIGFSMIQNPKKKKQLKGKVKSLCSSSKI